MITGLTEILLGQGAGRRALTLTPIGANLSHWADTVEVTVAIRASGLSWTAQVTCEVKLVTAYLPHRGMGTGLIHGSGTKESCD